MRSSAALSSCVSARIIGAVFQNAHLHGHLDNRHGGPLVSLQRILHLTQHHTLEFGDATAFRPLLHRNKGRHGLLDDGLEVFPIFGRPFDSPKHRPGNGSQGEAACSRPDRLDHGPRGTTYAVYFYSCLASCFAGLDHVVESTASESLYGAPSGRVLPAPHDHVAIDGVEFDEARLPLRLLAGD